MKVTKQMLNKELQSSYWMLKISSSLLMNKAGIGMLNRNSARARGKNMEGIHGEEKFIKSKNGGPDIRIRVFKPLGHDESLPGMLYIHGGGYLLGNPEDYLTVIKSFIDARPCVIIAPDYRKALDAPYPAAFNDCYDTLLWMNENAKELGIIPEKIIVGGHSAGGGIAAAVTLKATDTEEVKISFQMPIYPMIDDLQNTASATDNNAPSWNAKSNRLGWGLYLKSLTEQGIQVPAYAAAARAGDFSKLPPAITFVGDIEPFCDETVSYVENLKKAGKPVAFQLYEGCFHAFEIMFPKLEISKKAWAFLLDSYSSYIDKYVYDK